jgi:hypothetical protein
MGSDSGEVVGVGGPVIASVAVGANAGGISVATEVEGCDVAVGSPDSTEHPASIKTKIRNGNIHLEVFTT